VGLQHHNPPPPPAVHRGPPARIMAPEQAISFRPPTKKRYSVYDNGNAVWGADASAGDDSSGTRSGRGAGRRSSAAGSVSSAHSLVWDYVEVGPTPEPPARRDDIDTAADTEPLLQYNWDYAEMKPSTESSPWDCRGLNRVRVRHYLVSVLRSGRVGDFIVRDRAAEADTYALTVKTTAKQYATYAIEFVDSGKTMLRLRGSTTECFETMTDLVHYYASAPRRALGRVQLRLLAPQLSARMLGKRRPKRRSSAASAASAQSRRDSYLSLFIPEEAGTSE